MSIAIYPQEIKDGLDKAIASTLSFAYLTKPTLFTPAPEQAVEMRAIAGQDTSDLYYLSCVLASVGWNANDDVFDKVETFNARATPINKPFNFMHNEKDIIGHMTGSSILDASGKVIANTESVVEVPDQFDVLSESVLYKCWSDKDLQARMDKIIAEIADDKWFVSMECWFGAFDYAIILPNGDHKVIARNKDSAFLTKHLRVYGGKGVYQDHKIGRLLRGFAFSGKGLVDNPANKRSVIFNKSHAELFKGATASIKIFTKGNSTMEEILKQQLAEATKKLEEANAANAKAREEADKATATKLETLAKTVTEKEEALAKSKKDKDEAEFNKTAAETALATEKEKNTVLTAEINAMKAEAVKAARLNKLVTAGVSEEEATKLMAKFASASDEMFAEVVALKTEAAKNGNVDKAKTGKEGNADEKDTGDKKADKKANAGDETDVKGEAAAAATDVAATKVDEKPALTATPEVDKTAALRASAAAWIGKSVLRTTAKLNQTK